MSTVMDTERIDLLILARLAGPGKKPPQPKDVRDTLYRFVEGRLSAAEWRTRFEERVAALRERGDLDPGRLAATDAGRARVAAALGVDRVPAWKTLKTWLLPALALDLAPDAPRVRERVSKGEDLAGLVLARTHELPGLDTPTQTQVVDRLAWRALGVETDRPLKLDDVRRHVLTQLLDGGSRLPWKRLVPVLAANAVGARRPSADAVREALIGRWLERDESTPDARPAGAENALPSTAPAPAAFDLRGFAAEVQAAADREQEGRFGTRKVFISSVWRRLREVPASRFPDMDLDTFKRHLVAANRADLLGLHRADLVPKMNPEDVRASEITYGNATFHFIESPFVRR